jgi:glycosyltransferase involved in cell wall biosynthesis
MRPRRWSRKSEGRRVLIIVQNLPVPFDRRVWLEATTLAAAGYHVSVICPKAKGFTRSRETREGVDIYRYRLPFDPQGKLGFIGEFVWCWLMTALLSVRVALWGKGFHVMQACNPPETYWALAWLWRPLGIRFLFDHHDLSPEMYAVKFGQDGGMLYRGLLWLERMTFRTADAVICTNETYRAMAVTRGQCAVDEIVVVRSGPDLNRFVRLSADPALRGGKRFSLVYLGEMCLQDGVEHLVRAAALLRHRWGREDVHVTFIGDGPQAAVVEELARRCLPADAYTFTGRVSDDRALSRLLSSADLAVIPDPPNAYSDKCTMNKVMEYMFFGLPMVGYRLRENAVSAGPAAAYAEEHSDEALARVIHDLLNDPERRQRMSEAGICRVRDALAWHHSVPHLLRAYDRLFAERAQPYGSPSKDWAA